MFLFPLIFERIVVLASVFPTFVITRRKRSLPEEQIINSTYRLLSIMQSSSLKLPTKIKGIINYPALPFVFAWITFSPDNIFHVIQR